MTQSSMVAALPRESGVAAMTRSPLGGALGEIDTVADRLAVAIGRTARERRLATILFGHLGLLEQIEMREQQQGRLGRATSQARLRLQHRVRDLIEVLGFLLAEHHAELDGAQVHLGWARQSARIDAFMAGRTRLENAGLAVVA